MKDKNYLLLLDDVKDDINLYEIGIPYSNNRSKIVSMTRLHHVCSSMVKKEIRVTYLSTNRAWKMFQDVLGSPNLLKIQKLGHLHSECAKSAMEGECAECGGLPLLIEKVANTFKLKNDMYLWISFTKLRNGNATQEAAFGYSMISKLSRLEELVIDMKSPEQWSNEVVENIIKEVASLKELKILKFCISNKVVDFIKLVNMNLCICLFEVTSLRSFMERSLERHIQSIRFFQIFIGSKLRTS
ncbi:hypothetical protein HYC85_009904 [Camellia sinensis]|uniref:NB-ARC domain-containing protein n=1 Tax=Camellia sinensis TaxID=4442 RepID=A0A7J7HGC9_CAMSI|nr:hypothetical protein HYC85_009904 [Camellia sinensis]